jgi:polyhydroxybutyrate depolymerase
MPLVMMLHAYGVTGELEEWFFRLEPWARAHGFLYVTPTGTTNGQGRTYWNATDACCAPQLATGGVPEPDDETYLLGLLDEIATKLRVDPRRVYLVGHSNGAFMAHRLACRHADRFAAVVSVAGATYADPKRCPATSPVALLQIHGTADATIAYEGGAYYGLPYPGARVTAERWASIDGCAADATAGSPLDLDAGLDGPETRVLRWGACRAHTGVELWTIVGGSHVPTPTSALARGIVEFLFAHPKGA